MKRWLLSPPLRVMALVLLTGALILTFSVNVARAADEPPGSNTFPTTGPDALYQIDESGWSGDSQTSDAVNGWGDDQWQITLSTARSVSIQIVDCCIVGDNYEVYVDSQLIGTTPEEPLNGSTSSQGTFSTVLAAGSHLITVRDPGGVAYYQQGATYMIPAGYSVNITTQPAGFTDCPSSGSLGITLKQFDVFPLLGLIGKPWSLSYGELPLTWSPEAAPSASAVCTLDSNEGHLPVLVGPVDFPFVKVQVATSTAIAKLDFLGPDFGTGGVAVCNWILGPRTNCFLNTPGSQPSVVRWHTDGFQESVAGINVQNSGPLTFYVDTESVTGSDLSIPDILQPVETFIHTTLITYLPFIDSIAILQEPPNDLLVRDSSGHLTGRLPNGQVVTSIPGSIYLPARTNFGAAVAIIDQPFTSYSAEILGNAGAAFTLSASYVDFTSNGLAPTTVAQAQQQGRLGPDGTHASCFSIDPNLHCIGLVIQKTTINLNDNGQVEVALLADKQVRAADIVPSSIRFGARGTEARPVTCWKQDVNRDGRPDLICTFKISKTGLTTSDLFALVSAKTKKGLTLTGSVAIRVIVCRSHPW
jgi:hypothetical protein